MALDVPIGQEPSFSLICTFVKPLDSASFLISIPMKDGKPLPLDETQKLLICFGAGSEMQIVAGYADDIVKEGIRRCWKIRRVSEQRQFFRRVDERLRAAIPITYSQPTWQPREDGSIPTEYPREAAELLSLLPNYWLMPYFYPATLPEMEHRIRCLATMLDAIGVPIFDDELITVAAKGMMTFAGEPEKGSE